MTFEDRVRALEPFGFTPRQTRFLATVALHSGYCLRRQYAAFAGVQCGKNVGHFLERLVERRLAERFTLRADRGLIYHLTARGIYRAIGEEDNRNRRQASAALIARRIMVLDYVLGHPQVEWLATERDKVDLLTKHFAIPHADLPQRMFAASTPASAATTRYFLHKLPVAVDGDPPVVSFVHLAIDGTGRGLQQFMADHARLFASLPQWTVVAISSSPAALAACEAAFARARARPVATSTTNVEDLRWFFTTRQVVDSGDLTRVSYADIDRYRSLRERFAAASFDTLYADWCQQGEPALAAYTLSRNRPPRGLGQLVTEALKFDYSQFGSLPGIA
jgi:hypothetical protein